MARRDPSDGPDKPAIDAVLTRARHLVAKATAMTVALADLPELPALDPVPAGADQAQLHAIAVLYLAAELENAKVVPVVETLASLGMSGGLPFDLGTAAEPLAAFWRTRNERYAAAERQAVFDRLFGAPKTDSGDGFDLLFVDLCSVLYHSHDGFVQQGAVSVQRAVGIRTHALSLIEYFASRGSATAAFAANEMLAAIHQALGILDHPEIKVAFGARNLWDVVRIVSLRYSREQPVTAPHVRRGRAGLEILSWVGDNLPLFNSGGALQLTADDPIIGAAGEWIEDSLALTEAPMRAAAA